MLFDYHVHSHFSSDCNVPMEEMVKGAIQNGVIEMAICDHMDMEPGEGRNILDYKAFSAEVDRLSGIYGNDIHLLKGVELGLRTDMVKESLQFISSTRFDYILGAVHTIGEEEIFDPRSPLYEASKAEVFRAFLQYTLECVQLFPYFNVLAHIDVIRRYCPFEDKSMKYADYTDLLDVILLELIASRRGIEFNTGHVHYGLDDPFTDLAIVKRYIELGGEIITLGSDAHQPDRIATAFNDVLPALQDAGVKYITRFPRGRMTMFKL